MTVNVESVSRSEASRTFMEEHSTGRKVSREKLRTTAASRIKKAVQPPENWADYGEEVMCGKLSRE